MKLKQVKTYKPFFLLCIGLFLWWIIASNGQQILGKSVPVQMVNPLFLILIGALLATACFLTVLFLGTNKTEDTYANIASTKRPASPIESKNQNTASLENEKLAALGMMLKGEEEERRRISEDVHEGLGTLLSSIRLKINAINDQIEQKDKALNLLDQTTDVLDDAIGEVRRIAYYVMPGTLMNLGLIAAVEDLCRSCKSEFGILTSFQSFGINKRLDPNLEYAVYRIIQTALNNVIKFAEAKEILIQITRENYTLHLIIEDDGKGFNMDDYGPLIETYSYKAIYARISYIDGKLEIESEEGKGTSLMMEIPISHAKM